MNEDKMDEIIAELATMSLSISSNQLICFQKINPIIVAYHKQILDSARKKPKELLEFFNTVTDSDEICFLFLQKFGLFSYFFTQVCNGNSRPLKALEKNCRARLITYEKVIESGRDRSYELGFDSLPGKSQIQKVICSETKQSEFYSIIKNHTNLLYDILILSGQYTEKVIDYISVPEMARHVVEYPSKIFKILNKVNDGKKEYLLFLSDVSWITKLDALEYYFEQILNDPQTGSRIIHIISQPIIDQVFFKYPAKVLKIIKELGIDSSFLHEILRNEDFVVCFKEFQIYLDSIDWGKKQLQSMQMDSNYRETKLAELSIEKLIQKIQFLKYPKEYINSELLKINYEYEIKLRNKLIDIPFLEDQKRLNYLVCKILKAALEQNKGISVVIVGYDDKEQSSVFFNYCNMDSDFQIIAYHELFYYVSLTRLLNSSESSNTSTQFYLDPPKIVISLFQSD